MCERPAESLTAVTSENKKRPANAERRARLRPRPSGHTATQDARLSGPCRGQCRKEARRKTVPQIGDLDRYPEEADETDDYRHRMMTNIAGVAIAVALIAAGIWIADTMASMRKNQDCVLSGRRGCTPVDAPLPQRW